VRGGDPAGRNFSGREDALDGARTRARAQLEEQRWTARPLLIGQPPTYEAAGPISATQPGAARRKGYVTAAAERSADRIVLCNSIVTVICPTPPGTGVM